MEAPSVASEVSGVKSSFQMVNRRISIMSRDKLTKKATIFVTSMIIVAGNLWLLAGSDSVLRGAAMPDALSSSENHPVPVQSTTGHCTASFSCCVSLSPATPCANSGRDRGRVSVEYGGAKAAIQAAHRRCQQSCGTPAGYVAPYCESYSYRIRCPAGLTAD